MKVAYIKNDLRLEINKNLYIVYVPLKQYWFFKSFNSAKNFLEKEFSINISGV